MMTRKAYEASLLTAMALLVVAIASAMTSPESFGIRKFKVGDCIEFSPHQEEREAWEEAPVSSMIDAVGLRAYRARPLYQKTSEMFYVSNEPRSIPFYNSKWYAKVSCPKE